MTEEPEARAVDEVGAAVILERAAKLDAGSPTLDLSELREAALEAGISSSAFDRAVAELKSLRSRSAGALQEGASSRAEAVGLDEPLPLTTRVRSWIRPGSLLVGGAAIAGLSGLIEEGFGVAGEGGIIFSLVLLFQLFLYLVWRHRRGRSLLGFEIDLTALWIGFTLVLMLLNPRGGDDIAGVMSLVWAVASVVGGGLVALPKRDEPERISSG